MPEIIRSLLCTALSSGRTLCLACHVSPGIWEVLAYQAWRAWPQCSMPLKKMKSKTKNKMLAMENTAIGQVSKLTHSNSMPTEITFKDRRNAKCLAVLGNGGCWQRCGCSFQNPNWYIWLPIWLLSLRLQHESVFSIISPNWKQLKHLLMCWWVMRHSTQLWILLGSRRRVNRQQGCGPSCLIKWQT